MALKAVVLSGGKATRLEPLTTITPKALIPVLNVPFLEYVVRFLAGSQIEDIVLALGHLAEPIQRYLGDGSRFDARLHYSVEDTPLGSAGAAKNAGSYLDDTFLVFNGDDFIDLDIAAMLGQHRQRQAKVTIALTRVADPTSYGLVETDARGRVTRFLEKPKPEEVTTDTVNAGAWLVEPGVMSLVPPRTPLSFERNVFPGLLARGEPVYAYTSSGYWMDAGTPEKYLQLHRDLLEGKSRQYSPAGEPVIGEKTVVHPAAEINGPVVVGAGCAIGRGVKLTGPVVIGDGSAIGRGVKLTGPVVIGDGSAIGDGSIIENTVLWRNVSLGRGVNLRDSVIAGSCRLGAGVSGRGVVLGDSVSVADSFKFEPGSRIRPGEAVGD